MPYISLDRSIELSLNKREPAWKKWLEVNGITAMRCFHLTALNESLTAWEAECYETDAKGKARYVFDSTDGTSRVTFAVKKTIIQTTPALPDWVEREGEA